MKKLKISGFARGICLLALAAVFTAGCSRSQPAPDPATVTRVDPMAQPQPQSNGTTAQPAKPQDANFAADGEIALTKNFYFVFDGSGSMSWRINDAKWAVKEFMKNVPQDVNLGLYVFDGYGYREVLPLGPNNRQQFLTEIDKVSTGGGTPLGDATYKGVHSLVDQYRKQLGYGEYRLIVVTDGESSDNLDRGVAEANKFSIPIYTIGFGIGERHALRKHSISYRSADSAEELKQALEQAASELDVYDPTDFKQN